jgi:hypothetical protein
MLLGYQLPLSRPVDSVDSGVPGAPWVPTCCFATNENVLAEIKMFLPMKLHFCWFDPQFGKIHFFRQVRSNCFWVNSSFFCKQVSVIQGSHLAEDRSHLSAAHSGARIGGNWAIQGVP